MISKFKDEIQAYRLKKSAKKLHLPYMEWFIEYQHIRDGKVINSVKKRQDSPNRNFWNVYAMTYMTDHVGASFGAGSLSCTDMTATRRDMFLAPEKSAGETSGGFYNTNYAANLNGIWLGSGNNAETFEDYQPQTRITHGLGAGQLSYNQLVPLESFDALTKTWTAIWTAIIWNLSGGDITVAEVCLARRVKAVGAAYYYLMTFREKLPVSFIIEPFDQFRPIFRLKYSHL